MTNNSEVGALIELRPCPFCGKRPTRLTIGTAYCDGIVDGKIVHNTISMEPRCWNVRTVETLYSRVKELEDALAEARPVVMAMTGTEWAGVGGFRSWQEADDSLRSIKAKIVAAHPSIKEG